jgi:hypothetical protein
VGLNTARARDIVKQCIDELELIFGVNGGKMLSKKLIVLVFMCCGLFLNCAPAPPVLQPEIAEQPVGLAPLGTFEENFREGQSRFNAGQFMEANHFLQEAIRLNPKSQQAHLLAGISLVKLGKSYEAMKELGTTIDLDPKSSDAAKAREWMNRTQQRLPMAMVPLTDQVQIQFFNFGMDSSNKPSTAEGKKFFRDIGENFVKESVPDLCQLYESDFAKTIINSGYYAVTPIGSPGKGKPLLIVDNYKGDNPQPRGLDLKKICQEAGKRGDKIVVAPKLVELVIKAEKKITKHVLSNFLGNLTHYTLDGNVTVEIISTKDCRTLKVLQRSKHLDSVGQTNLEQHVKPTITKMFQTIFQELVVDLNAALL